MPAGIQLSPVTSTAAMAATDFLSLALVSHPFVTAGFLCANALTSSLDPVPLHTHLMLLSVFLSNKGSREAAFT